MQERSALHQELKSAIFNPEALQGEQGERTLSQWQADSVITALQKFYPHIEQVYAAHLSKLHEEPEAYSVTTHLQKLADLIGNPANHDQIDLGKLSQSIEAVSQQVSRELAHRDAMLQTAILIQAAMVRLLNTNDVFIGTHWIEGMETESRLGQPALFAHVWSFAADSHEIPSEKILFVSDLVERFGPQAIQAWVCFERGWAKPLKGDLGADGIATLKYLESISRDYQPNALDKNQEAEEVGEIEAPAPENDTED